MIVKYCRNFVDIGRKERSEAYEELVVKLRRPRGVRPHRHAELEEFWSCKVAVSNKSVEQLQCKQ